MSEGWDAFSMCMVDRRTQPSEHGDCRSSLVWATCFWMEYVSTPLAAEAWVNVEQIWFAREMGFGSVEIEGDSLVVIMKLRSPHLDHSDISSYVLEAQQLAKAFATCRWQHIHREGNSVAHLMAQEGFLLLNR
ncbi:hypothetical protein Goari_000053 [Gossypium aridum]|uniref:RNase H type-1 domain-containing protein n=1 Tax=Gossypium aridum TaxID=34290 RepID=A0A7J8YL81_GOSAI|nr:hypothetical protein [Gossypium aridum]